MLAQRNKQIKKIINKQKTNNDMVTATQSLTLIKSTMRMAISSICYHRKIFSDECFTVKRLPNGYPVHSMLPKTHHSEVVYKWLEEGVFDALERRMLSDVWFDIYEKPNPNGKIELELESYHFDIDYNTNITMEVKEKGNNSKRISLNAVTTPLNDQSVTREAIKSAISNTTRHLIILISDLKPLPEHYYVSMRVQYANWVPNNYQPTLFRAGMEADIPQRNRTLEPVIVRSKPITTHQHKLRTSIRSCFFNMEKLRGTDPRKQIISKSGKFVNETSAVYKYVEQLDQFNINDIIDEFQITKDYALEMVDYCIYIGKIHKIRGTEYYTAKIDSKKQRKRVKIRNSGYAPNSKRIALQKLSDGSETEELDVATTQEFNISSAI